MPEDKIDLPTHIDLTQFVSEQAHDLRTPFNHIVGFSRMLLINAEESQLSVSEKDDLGTIYRNGMRALMRLNGLIDIARIALHETEADIVELDIGQLIDESRIQWEKYNTDDSLQAEFKNLAAAPTLYADEVYAPQFIAGFLLYVSLYCASNAKVAFVLQEEPDRFVLSFIGTGGRTKRLPEIDLQLLGYVDRALVEMQGGEILKAEKSDSGAVVQIALPKLKTA